MTEQVIQRYEDGQLVGIKKVQKKKKKPKLNTILQKIDVVRAAHKKYGWEYDVMLAEIYEMRRKVLQLEKLLKIRTKERDGASWAHKQRLEELNELKELYEDIAEEDEEEEEEEDEVITLKDVENDRPHAVAAKAIRKDDD
jgi:hypothetical protein